MAAVSYETCSRRFWGSCWWTSSCRIELAGVADITSKSLGSNTPINVVRATVEGLKQLKRAEEVAALRGKSVEEIIG